ncbi:MAG: deacetylase [Burkholderiales bacterium]|jgi:peptidoglycan/xylan/chitin deacetylase (PgdA/CDA1 family)|nr:deacetylase [Burkholderiales bacterium]
MPPPFFIITIDTEGDNLWTQHRHITTENARYLQRFQTLCERFAFKPVYLTNFEMANDPVFQAFGRDVLRKGTGEIGTHVHAWNNPPLTSLTDDDDRHQPYLIEYPEAVMREKFLVTHRLLEDVFQTPMVSHRAGRWAFDARYAKLLAEHGYHSDCSVTPEISWRTTKGDPTGQGGTDYRAFPRHAYFLDLDHIERAGHSTLLEVPMTTRLKHGALTNAIKNFIARCRGKSNTPSVAWLRPRGGNVTAMQTLAARVLTEPAADYLEFMLHSSEFMPGGSPTFQTAEHIEKLYADLETLFSWLATRCRGATLEEYYRFRTVSI